ncbi:MAG: sigma-70 family RNA polymerase sigma factor [Planctomycetota bacterium]|nr:sigma-70 family RNA polymerase sigma factor [Planctomycetota bacterium]
MSDAECLRKFLATGSPEAFGVLVERYQGLVYARCVWVLQDPSEAEDATQATFLVFFKKIRSLANSGNLAGWFYRTAEFTARNLLKMRRRRERHAQEVRAMNELREAAPEADSDGKARAALYVALGQLPEATRDALVRHFFMGMSLAEVAAESGAPPRTVSSRVQSGLEKLRRALKRHGLTVSAAALPALLSPAFLPHAPAHLSSALQAACLGGSASAASTALAGTTLQALAMAKVKAALLPLLAVSVLAAGTAAVLQSSRSRPVLPLVQSIQRFGITWRLDRPAPVGYFVNGDPYVVGPVTIVSVEPAPHDGLHGSMKNPGAPDRFALHREVRGYEAERAAEFPLELKPGDTLLSTIGASGGEQVARPYGGPVAGPLVRAAAVLTCLGAAVSADSFRPPFAGSERPIFRAEGLRRELLPNLAFSGRPEEGPDWARMERMLERPWLETAERGLHNLNRPAENMPRLDYIAARCIGDASLALCLDVPAEKKETLLIRLVQLGIDEYGWQRARLEDPGAAGESAGIGRKWSILLAGLLLGEPSLLSPPGVFAEDVRAGYAEAPTGPLATWSEELPERSKEEKDPADAENRRRQASAALAGQALAVRLLKAELAWGHPAFLDYMDRWMFSPEPEGGRYDERGAKGETRVRPAEDLWSARFAQCMWKDHRRLSAAPAAAAGAEAQKGWLEDLKPAQAQTSPIR